MVFTGCEKSWPVWLTVESLCRPRRRKTQRSFCRWLCLQSTMLVCSFRCFGGIILHSGESFVAVWSWDFLVHYRRSFHCIGEISFYSSEIFVTISGSLLRYCTMYHLCDMCQKKNRTCYNPWLIWFVYVMWVEAGLQLLCPLMEHRLQIWGQFLAQLTEVTVVILVI